MKVLFLICIVYSLAFSQLPSKFTLVSNKFESNIYHNDSATTKIAHHNYKAECMIYNDSCKIIRTDLVTNTDYAEGIEIFKVSKENKMNIYVIERTNCGRHYRYILDFNNNTFLGSQIYCTYDVYSIGMEVCIEKGVIMVQPNTIKCKFLFKEEVCK